MKSTSSKRARKTAEDWESRLERFLTSPLAKKASQGLSDRICIALHVDGERHFFFGREDGKNTLGRVEPEGKPDIHFWIGLSTLRHLLALAEDPRSGIATMGIAIFEHIFSKDEAKKIRFRVDSGFLTLWSKGYFSVLKAGGPEVASYLARFGFSGLGAIKEVLRKVRP
jgi:hypothetical protein